MVILENIDIDIDIDKAILHNIDIDKISNRFKFGISNRARRASLIPIYWKMKMKVVLSKFPQWNTEEPLLHSRPEKHMWLKISRQLWAGGLQWNKNMEAIGYTMLWRNSWKLWHTRQFEISRVVPCKNDSAINFSLHLERRAVQKELHSRA